MVPSSICCANALYISGYANDAMEQRGILAEGRSFLRKPFTPEEIARALRDVLDEERVKRPYFTI